VCATGYHGLVIEGAGGGHVTAISVAKLGRLAEHMPVVLASRTGAGAALRRTYSFPGSEIDLLGSGLIPAGFLTGAKARMFLRFLLAAGASLEEVRKAFDALATPGVHASLLGGRLTVTSVIPGPT
jgi:L-asparaginase